MHVTFCEVGLILAICTVFSTAVVFSFAIQGFKVLLQSILAAAEWKAVQETGNLLKSHVALKNWAIGRNAYH